MSAELWVEGVIVQFSQNRPCARAMIRRVGQSEVVFADIVEGKTYRLDRSSLEQRYRAGEVSFLAQSKDLGALAFVDLTEREQRETNRRHHYIQYLHERGVSKITEQSAGALIAEVAKTLDEKSPHWQSVRNWYQSYAAAGYKIRGLYPRHRHKGTREARIDQKIVEIIQQEAGRYFRGSQPSMASIVRNVEEKIIAHNLDCPEEMLKPPTFLTVQKRVMDVSYQKKQKAREGKNSFQAELASSDSGIETSRVLERVEIDHTLLDIHVLHDDHQTLLGRPNITVLIDHYSHCLLYTSPSPRDRTRSRMPSSA